MKRALTILVLSIIAISSTLKGQSCDHYYGGVTGGVTNSGETGCLNADLAGAVTIQPGGILRVCGVIEITGSVTINANGFSTPGKVILTEGTSVHVSSGSWTFNDQQQLEYDGDAGCNAEIYKTFGTANVLMFNPPGPLCNSSNIYLSGFWFQWGDFYRGSAQLGRAPSLCGGSVGGCEGVLPVELAYFDAEKKDYSVQLKWQTLSELNNDYFLLEKSSDGVNWTTLKRVEGAGNSINPIDYDFEDYSTSKNETYYRLTQVDFDGETEVFKVISINTTSTISDSFSVYPNPTQNSFSLNFDVDFMEVVSLSGEVLFSGSNITRSQKIDISKFASGLYYVRVSVNGLVSVSKVTKN